MPELLEQQNGCKVFILAAPEKVFETITSASGWDAFFTSGAEVDARVGGHIKFKWKDWGPDLCTTEDGGPIVEFDPPGRFAFQWHPIDKHLPVTVTFAMLAKHGGTIVELTESGYVDTSKSRRTQLDCASGWGEALALLKFYLEYGVTYQSPKVK